MNAATARFTPAEDAAVIRLRRAGMTFAEIAGHVSGRTQQSLAQRHKALKAKSRSTWDAAPLPLNRKTGQEVFNQECVKACQRLLKRQLQTGQYSGAAREAWLAKHGDAG